MGLTEQPRDEQGKFATTGAAPLAAWAAKKSKTESPAKVIAKAKHSDSFDMTSILAAQGGKGQTDHSAKASMDKAKDKVDLGALDKETQVQDAAEMGMDPMVLAQYRAADVTSNYFKADASRLERIRDYTGTGNADMNLYLRDPKNVLHEFDAGVKLSEAQITANRDEVAENARLFAIDLKNAPKAPGDVLRGTKMAPEVVAKLQVGKTFEARGHLSTTSDPDVANGFTYTGDDRARFMLHITQKSGVFVGGVSKKEGEMETIVPHGTRFRIDKVKVEQQAGMQGAPLNHLWMHEV